MKSNRTFKRRMLFDNEKCYQANVNLWRLIEYIIHFSVCEAALALHHSGLSLFRTYRAKCFSLGRSYLFPLTVMSMNERNGINCNFKG